MMNKKLISILLICILCVLGIAVYTAKTGSDNKSTVKAGNEAEIKEAVTENFELLTKVPRPSHHEKQISDYLAGWAKEHGFSPVQDDIYNLMIDVPASKGYENRPLCILQGHMDMVVAVAEGKEFDPLSDPITMVRDEKAGTLTADGTSLGADDGIGVAIIMAVMQGKMKHGPLRVLITVDEEDGMDGVFNMDASWVNGVDYLINIDNETSDDVLVSTAAGDSIEITKKIARRKAEGDLALDITLGGLKGGHSGIEIDKGRLNGVIGLASFLKEMDKGGIPFELAGFEGGTASNAIPTKATCTIVVSSKDQKAIEEFRDKYLEELEKEYSGIEENMTLTIKESDSMPEVVSEKEKKNIIRFITKIINGVYTWSEDMKGLVESSSNLGILTLDKDGLAGKANVRSSVGKLEDLIVRSHLKLAKAIGCEAKREKMADAWTYNPDSRLLAMTQEIYKEQNGKKIKVSALHAGLECGTFQARNPNLDMVSIGPDIADAHTVNETLYLDSVPKVWNLLEGLLDRIGE